MRGKQSKKQKRSSAFILGLLLISCLAGCNNRSANSSQPENDLSSSATAPTDNSSSAGENSGGEASAAVFDFESQDGHAQQRL